MIKRKLLLLALPLSIDSFLSTPSHSRRRNLNDAARMPTVQTAPTLESSTAEASELLSELTPSQGNSPILSPSESPMLASTSITNDVTAMMPTDTIQSRSIPGLPDRDTLINSSIFLLAIGIVLERVLSVDVGITRGWSPTEIAERIPLDNWRSYTNILNMAPLQTKAVTSATVYMIGDILAQSKETTDDGEEGLPLLGGIGKLDRLRVLRSLLAGLIGHGPMSHVWYHVSEDFFDNVLNLHAWWDFIPKVVVDQTFFGPIWNNSYILLLGLMQFQKPGQIWGDMKRTTIPLIVSGLKLWPFVHCITYGLIPVENRLLWVDAVEIVWVTILAGEAASAGDDGNNSENEGEVLIVAAAADQEDSTLR